MTRLTATERRAIRKYAYDQAVRYRITADGELHMYGSDDPFDRSKDYWRFGGYVDQVLELIALETE